MISFNNLMKDDKKNPLLGETFGKEYERLNEETSTFNTSIEDINKDLDTKSVEDSSNISNLTLKLQNIKSHMERISDKIQYLKNFLKDDTTQNQLLILSKIRIISDNISRKYEEVNKKFTEKIAKAKRKIENEILESENAAKNGDDSMNPEFAGKVFQKLDSKVRIGIDRLRERHEDLEKISKISYQLLELSRDMRRSAENQGRMVASIEDYITVSNTKINDANEQLNKKIESQSTNVKLYFWIASVLFVIIAIVIVFIYWKYWKVNQHEVQKENQSTFI